MKKLIFIFVVILSSCITQKKCFNRFPPDTITVKQDTTIFRDTIVFKKIIGDTVYVEKHIPHIIYTERSYEPIFLKTSLCASKSWIAGNRLKMRLIQKDSIFQFKLDSAIKANKQIITKTKIIEKPIAPNPFWKNGFFILGGILIIFLILLVFRNGRFL